ncbi:MAG: DUF4332 domain-containing protein [Candidatus Thorarchaeota archaeon]
MKLHKLTKLAIALEDLGTETTLQLMRKCQTPASRREFVKVLAITKIDLKRIAETSKLIQIEGIGEKEVKILEAVGIDTTEDLSKGDAETLYNEIIAYSEEKGIRIPSKEEVEGWIEQAEVQ